MFDGIITLFNYRDSDGTWATSLFQNVDVIELEGSVATKQGAGNDDNVEIILDVDQSQQVAGKQYVKPKQYQALDDVSGHFTFTPEVDFIVVGDYTSDNPIIDDDYDEGLYHAMNHEHDGVYMITSATWFSLLPHFEMTGR